MITLPRRCPARTHHGICARAGLDWPLKSVPQVLSRLANQAPSWCCRYLHRDDGAVLSSVWTPALCRCAAFLCSTPL
jgi:hypothetical protein